MGKAAAHVKVLHTNEDWSDGFCGAGGSSTGLALAGQHVRYAANHWRLALDTHGANHPDTDHVHCNVSQADPRNFPRTRYAWWSPSCTHHSGAQGRPKAPVDLFGAHIPDDEAERSRATMWDVVRFAELHRQDYIIVENVVEAALVRKRGVEVDGSHVVAEG